VNQFDLEVAASTRANRRFRGFATPVEAASFLRLSRAMVHKLIVDGKMPARRYGRAVRIPWDWLTAQAREGSQ